MYMLLGERKFNVDFNIHQSEPSKHTGKPLRRLELLTSTKNKQISDHITEMIKRSNEQIILGDDSGNEGRWKIIQSSYSYTGNENPVYKHKIDVVEEERLFADRLLIDELELIPYFYKEEFEGDRLVIEAKVKVDQLLFEKLVETSIDKEMVTVLREGILPQKRVMEFLVGTWSVDHKTIKLWVLLSDPHEDKKDSTLSSILSPLGVHLRNVKKALISQSSIITQLIILLKEKNVIDDNDVNQALEKNGLKIGLYTRMIDFAQDEDIDK